MSDVYSVMTDSEALERIKAMAVGNAEMAFYKEFIENFPGARFYYNSESFIEEYQEEEDVVLPEWFQTHLQTLAGAFPAEGSLMYQFASFMDDSRSPLADQVENLWFKIGLTGWPSGKRQREALQHSSAKLSLFPIGVVTEDEGYQLAINLKQRRDRAVYLFHLNDVMSMISEGEDIAAMTFKVFASPGDMLSRVKAIQHGAEKTLAK